MSVKRTTADEIRHHELQRLRAIRRENRMDIKTARGDAQREDRTGPAAARGEEFSKRTMWNVEKLRAESMNFAGRQWLSRIKYALSAAYAIEEDPFWKGEFLRALILVHKLWETGKISTSR
jgi:hypothetical protein